MPPTDGANYVPETYPSPDYRKRGGYGASGTPGGLDDGFGRGSDFGSTTQYGGGRQRGLEDYQSDPVVDEPPRTAPAPKSPRGRFALFGSAESGLPGWLGVVLMVAVGAIGSAIDSGGAGGGAVPAGFGWGLVVGAFLAGLVGRRSSLFTVVVAPPLVYAVVAIVLIYSRSGGLKNRSVLIDSASNLLVYGFPAIAGATAIVLLIAGVRMVIRR